MFVGDSKQIWSHLISHLSSVALSIPMQSCNLYHHNDIFPKALILAVPSRPLNRRGVDVLVSTTIPSLPWGGKFESVIFTGNPYFELVFDNLALKVMWSYFLSLYHPFLHTNLRLRILFVSLSARSLIVPSASTSTLCKITVIIRLVHGASCNAISELLP